MEWSLKKNAHTSHGISDTIWKVHGIENKVVQHTLKIHGKGLLHLVDKRLHILLVLVSSYVGLRW